MKKYIFLLTAFLAAGITGCKKNFLSQEVNPNQPSVATPALLLAGALNNSAGIVSTDYVGYGVWVGYWTTSGNYVPNQVLNQYQITNGDLNGTWGAWYSTLANFNAIQTTAGADASQANYVAIAMIMKAYGFQHLVDQFGDVPYSQAFQPSTIIFPAYDKATAIYEDLGKQLDAAIALIQKSGSAASPGASDIVFGGDMTGWLKFANTLKLKLALRVSEVSPTDPLIADLASTSSVGYLDGTTEAYVNPGYSAVAGKQNPFYAAFGYDVNGNPGGDNVYYRANAYEVGLLVGTNDPRTSQIFSAVTPPPGSAAGTPNVIRGNIFGDVTSGLLTNTYTSGEGPGLIASSSQGQPLLLGSESLFLQAEASARSLGGFLPGNAETLYEAGIKASFVEMGLTADQATTYYTTSTKANVNWAASSSSTDAEQQAIITQKYIALTGNLPFEAWNEYRRTGYPAGVPSSADPAKVNPTTPYRVLYPQSELSTNASNLAKEGTITFSSKIFWMK